MHNTFRWNFGSVDFVLSAGPSFIRAVGQRPQSHGPHAHCLRFAGTVVRLLPTETQDSFPAGEVALAVQDLNLRGSNVRFQTCSNQGSGDRAVERLNCAAITPTSLAALAGGAPPATPLPVATTTATDPLDEDGSCCQRWLSRSSPTSPDA
jgi:hypothetical protein